MQDWLLIYLTIISAFYLFNCLIQNTIILETVTN